MVRVGIIGTLLYFMLGLVLAVLALFSTAFIASVSQFMSDFGIDEFEKHRRVAGVFLIFTVAAIIWLIVYVSAFFTLSAIPAILNLSVALAMHSGYEEQVIRAIRFVTRTPEGD